ncbi:hypothetical protein Tco_0508103 [Tanacetum coccineum]
MTILVHYTNCPSKSEKLPLVPRPTHTSDSSVSEKYFPILHRFYLIRVHMNIIAVNHLFQKEREQYHEIQDLKAQLQDKNIAISELKKLIEKCKGKSVETKFDKPSVVRQPNAQRIPKPSVLRKPNPFSDSLERKKISQTKSVPKTNVPESLSKPVTPYSWPQVRKSSFAKLYDVNAPGPSRNSPKHVSFQSPQEFVGSNDTVHNYSLEEAKKNAQL